MTATLSPRLSPIDTLMFRDGRPFNQQDAGASLATSVFPPPAPTIVGAIRAALWRANGGKAWPATLLGDGTDWFQEGTLAPLRFGPLLLTRPDPNGDGEQTLFPLPAHVIKGEGTEGPLSLLLPGPVRETDLGPCALPCPPVGATEIKPPQGDWVTAKGMESILRGEVPPICETVRGTDLWRMESRVGIGLSANTRTTSDGHLYMASHARVASGVALALTLDGYSGPVPGPRLQALGGEHRMAELSFNGAEPEMPDPRTGSGRVKENQEALCLIQLSPLVLDPLPGPGELFPGLPFPARVVSACLGRPEAIGGWDSQGRSPLPLRPVIPAGAVWFLKGEVGKADTGTLPNRVTLGKATDWGFGHMLVGRWKRRPGNHGEAGR